MKKIVMINSIFGRKSTGNIIMHLSESAIQNGFDVKAFYGYGKTDCAYAKPMANSFYTKFNILKTRVFGKHGFYSKWATRRLIRWLKAFDPHLIHIQQVHGHYLNIPLLFSYLKKYNKPTIITLHDCWLFTGHCVHFESCRCEKWKTQCYHCEQKHTYPITWFFDRSKQNYLAKKKYFTMLDNLTLIAPSKWLFDYLGESFLKSTPRKVIHNGIDTKIFQPCDTTALKQKYAITDEFVVLGMAQKWIPHGQNTIDLIKRLGKDYRIILIGETIDQPLPSHVINIPYVVDQNELAGIYSLANVFVNLTMQDTFPTVNIEALACGTPVITFDSGGSGEAVDNNTGIIVKQMDFDGIYSAIKSIEKNDDAMVYACVERAHKLFDKQKCYDEYIHLYHELIGEKTI